MSYGPYWMPLVWNNHVMGHPEYKLSGECSDQGPRVGWYFATLRNKATQRPVVNLGAAAHIAYGIAHAPIMIVNMSKALQK
jgi:hypothetical protein